MNNNVEEKFEIPVLFIIFNRLDTTKKVFEAIKEIKPTKLYIASDGPRTEKEFLKVQAVRDYVTSECDWQCTLKTRFRIENLGAGFGVNDAINWFFENENAGIILEDDCLPSKSFFYFCKELLIKFEDNKKIGVIQGFNPFPKKVIENSYFFSKYDLKWGWATWRDRWQNQDMFTKDWTYIKKKKFIKRIFIKKRLVARYWYQIFDLIHRSPHLAWDTQFTYKMLLNNMLTIVPSKNIVMNIGYGSEASSTKWGVPEHIMNLTLQEIFFPLVHNEYITIDDNYDSLVERIHFNISLNEICRLKFRNILESNEILKKYILPMVENIYRKYKKLLIKVGIRRLSQ